jgi:hypothetical protein
MPKVVWMSALAAATVALGACGDDAGGGGTAATSTSGPATTAPATRSAGLDPLVGTYTTRVPKGDGPASAQGSWTIVISKSGGVNGAPSMAIRESGADEAFATAEPHVEGAALILRNQECDDSSAQALITAKYRYELTENTLRLTRAPGSARCEDRIFESILTARPLSKHG